MEHPSISFILDQKTLQIHCKVEIPSGIENDKAALFASMLHLINTGRMQQLMRDSVDECPVVGELFRTFCNTINQPIVRPTKAFHRGAND